MAIERHPAARVEATGELHRLLMPGVTRRESLLEYRGRGGYAPEGWAWSPEELRDRIAASGLRGRGGAAFPTGRKWHGVAARPGPRVVLVNAAESEPASAKDRILLLRRPHLVLEGALLAARAIDAREIVLYLHANATAVRDSLDLALRELRAARTPAPRLRIVTAPPGYVAGEASAAVRRANGGPAKPTSKPPRPSERGVGKRPTLVQNVETLANVPLIARHGPEWLREVGAPSLPGTLLVTLSGAVNRPGVYEVPSGMPLQRIVDDLGGGVVGGASVQAMLVGGYFAGWLGPEALAQGARLEPESLRAWGVSLGAAAIVVVPDWICGLAQAAWLMRFFADESAQQCGTCLSGTRAMAAVFAKLLRGTASPAACDRLHLWAERMLPGRGACGHLDGAATAARTALQVFADEISQHARAGGCGRPETVILPGFDGGDLDVTA
ncbi:MAG: NADH-ubiquinone oxidoreductase-F iron-sulfur binding region domain-containing protein [Sphaerobacter sp.]|nr:NADH-ubiquinone oxidoreductase-F iron-sulfur binding region domain-containing protein [Sphaerobacter sp.]